MGLRTRASHLVEVPLYSSNMKFDCGCGWPGFWTNVKAFLMSLGHFSQDAVYEQRDKDGRRP